MQRTIHAIFDSGVFRPLEPIDLANGTEVSIAVPMARRQKNGDAISDLSAEQIAGQQKAIDNILFEIENLPIEEADDGFSGSDHDQVLYGSP